MQFSAYFSYAGRKIIRPIPMVKGYPLPLPYNFLLSINNDQIRRQEK
jgi:hypothetical protein